LSEEKIIVRVDDVEIDMAIAKLKQAVVLATTSLPGGGDMSDFAAFWDKIGSDFGDTATKIGNLERVTGVAFKDIPTINREVRILLGQVPGMRTAMRTFFNIRRLLRGFDIGEMQLAISLLVVAVLLMRWLGERQRRLERQQRDYEMFIRRERGLTHDQYVNLMTQWQGFYRRRPG
jgi:hypothetical protein